MIELTATMSTISSLHIGTGKKIGTFSKTLEYVPGRTLRGMVGYYLYTQNKALFDKLNLKEDANMSNTGVFFKDAHPMYENRKTVASPVSLKWCKRCEHVLERDSYECRQEKDGKPCLHEGKKVAGFITSESLESGELEKAKISTHIETKCPITRSGHTSPSSDLKIAPYHVESIISGTNFNFRCVVKDEYVDELKDVLCESGVFSGLGGYRSRGYGLVAFNDFKKTPVSEVVEERVQVISQLINVIMVTNSPMILKNSDKSIVGFGSGFENYLSLTADLCGVGMNLKIHNNNGEVIQRLSESIARGWSIKEGNRVSEIIPCIGMGSCLNITSYDPELLAYLEIYGIGEMINSGYGDVYFMEGKI